MFKIKVVLADFDSDYVDRVTDYINTAHPAIRVTVFTRAELLAAYMRDSSEQVNIILAHPDFLGSLELCAKAELVVALSDGTVSGIPEGLAVLFKYQPGDVLLSRLISLYSDKNPGAPALLTGGNSTKLVSVYSPAGGVGKTSLVLGLASRLGEMGRSVLIISFESIGSIRSALSCCGTDGMSHLLLTARETPELLPIKIETCKTRDCHTGVDFIEPAACFLEISDAGPDDIRSLLAAVRNMAKFDVVLLDLDSAADRKTGEVLECCHCILLVQTADSICHFKTAEFLRQLERIAFIEQARITDKFIPVLNRYVTGQVFSLDEFGLETAAAVPEIRDLWPFEDGRYTFDPSGLLSGHLGGLAERILNLNAAVQPACTSYGAVG